MIINFFCNLIENNTYDVSILTKIILSPPNDIKVYDYQHTTIRNSDVSIYLDYINPIALYNSKVNILISNVHKKLSTIDSYLHLIHYIFCKTDDTEEYFYEIIQNIDVKPKIKNIGWTSFDKYKTTTSNSKIFYTTLNNNNYEKVKNIADSWLSTLPKLQIYCYLSKNDVRVLDLVTISNIDLYMGENPNGTIYIHTETDDYPYILFESSSMGHIVIAPNLKPYNNWDLSIFYNNDDLNNKVQKIYDLDNIEFKKKSDNSRAFFLKYQKSFLNNFEKTLIKIFEKHFSTDELNENKILDIETPLVSIITLTYNREHLFKIPLYIQSKLTYKNIEWIIVDDSLNSNIQTLLKKNTHYIKLEERHTIGAKRNIGVEKATGQYIMFMDDDDFYPPNVIENRLKTIGRYECSYCSSIACYDIYRKNSFINCPNIFETYYNRVSEATLFFKKQFWYKKRFIEDGSLGEGREFIKGRYQQCIELDWKGCIISLIHGSNVSQKKQPLQDPNGCHFLNDEWGMTEEFLNIIN
jgi:hypothetical protein